MTIGIVDTNSNSVSQPFQKLVISDDECRKKSFGIFYKKDKIFFRG